jgi:hypothetical protein
MLVASICVGAIAGLQLPQLQRLQPKSQIPSIEQIRQEIEAETTRLNLLKQIPTLGFNNLVADWTFLSFLQYFGDTPARQKSDYRLSPKYFEVILKQDPYFLEAYPYLSTSASLYAGVPEQSTALIQQSLSSLKPNVPPQSYYAWRQLGIDQLLFLGDPSAARSSFETAAAWARSSSVPGSEVTAQLSEQTATFLAQNPNSKRAQIAAWVMVLTSAPDENTQKIAVRRIELLGGKVVRNPDGSFSIQAASTD